jgi:hypothetical protein
MTRKALPIAAAMLAACLWLHSSAVSARVIDVGPTEKIKTVAEAARLAQDDDLVQIAPGDYRGDVAIWTQKRLTIRGVGQRPVLSAAGANAEGKAIWVIRNGDFKVTNIEFRGARVADGNGAGIRFERGKLHVDQCAFLDNQMGILTGGHEDAELFIENSIFGQAPKQQAPLPHLLYVGKIGVLRVVASRFHGGYFGHLLKSRARVTDIRYSLLVDGAGGRASYEAEFPNGGDVTLVGNVLGQSIDTENRVMVAYGAEGSAWPRNRLRVVHNTLYSEGIRPAWFLRVFDNNLGSTLEVLALNNLLIGLGPFSLNLDGQHQGNFYAPTSVLGDPSTMDFTLGQGSWLRGKVDRVTQSNDDLSLKYEHILPGRVTPINPSPNWAPGAIQAPTLGRP